MSIKESFVVDAQGNKIGVFLSIKEYNKLLDELEELEDIRLYDQVKKRQEQQIPFDQYLQHVRTTITPQ